MISLYKLHGISKQAGGHVNYTNVYMDPILGIVAGTLASHGLHVQFNHARILNIYFRIYIAVTNPAI